MESVLAHLTPANFKVYDYQWKLVAEQITKSVPEYS